ncbi:serine/threonine-protein phosphatase 6 regulatory ankyrin repeat subunit B-like [Physella acuta]|uniref:serine/threonine-protein phosphatase 6 regulatory ankyrin repeat subunit B-like n=1 Tax=Physella acuta TaxID=109671 RepID=UPI0027DC2E94|nr:serine/threonine-protein phosphatase 6 regulatory ankyrin repeat subunit B-like [Physella acuta]
MVKLLLEHKADVNLIDSNDKTALCYSVENGFVEIVKLLVDNDADVNYASFTTPLHESCKRETFELVKMLVEAGADVNKIDKSGDSPLCISAQRGKIDIVIFLVENGADVNIGKSPPLFYACDEGYFEITKYLVDSGADVNLRNSDGESALGKSVFKGHLDIVKILLEKGADVNYTARSFVEPALLKAVSEGHFNIVELLLQYGANVNYTSGTTGETALLNAARRGHSNIVELLLQYGADVNKIDKEGNNALIVSLQGAHVKTVEILVQCQMKTSILNGGISINQTNNIGRSSFMLAAMKGLNEIVLDIKKYSDSSVFDVDGNRAFMLAAMNGHLDIVELLYDGTVDANFKGQNALMLAAIGGHATVVEWLISKGFDVNKTDHHGITALMMAGKKEVVEVLLKHGADVNKTDHHGNTALMMAGKKEVVEVLLKHGADVNVRNCDGRNALMELLSKNKSDLLTARLHPHYNSNEVSNDTSLMLAVKNNSSESVKLLLANSNVNVNDVGNDGNSALMLALQMETPEHEWSYIKAQRTDIIQELLHHGIDVNHVNNNKTSVLMLAVQKRFIPAGVDRDIDMGDIEGKTALMYAVETWFNKDVVRQLLEHHKADVNVVDNKGKTALMYAVERYYCKDVVRQLLQHHKANVNVVDNEGKTALMYAVETRGNDDVVRQLLEHHMADVNVVDNEGKTALMYAVETRGNDDVVRQLLEHHMANVNLVDNEGKTALMYAVQRYNCKDVVRQLLEHHMTDVNVVDNAGETALIKAVKNDKGDNVRILLEHKADIYIQDKQGRTALMWAAKANFSSLFMTKLLLETTPSNQSTHQVSCHMSALDQTDNKRRTAFMWATKRCDLEVMEYLLERGVCVSQIDAAVKKILITAITRNTYYSGFKLTASGINFILNFASEYPNILEQILTKSKNLTYFDLVDKDSNTLLMLYAKNSPLRYGSCNNKLLLKIKQDVNAVNKYKKTALMIALENRNYEFIERVCKLYKEDDVVCPKGRTLLMMAAQACLVDTVKYLVSKGSKVNQVDKKQRTALMYVSYFKPVPYQNKDNTFELIEYLLVQDADVNVSDYKHETMLIKILKKKVEENVWPIIEHLLDKNAQANVIDRDGRSPLMIAIIQLGLINQRRNNGFTYKNIQQIIKQLTHVVHILINKANGVNTTDNNGNTALMLASKYGLNNVVQVLIKKTDDINRVNKKGQTAYDLALKNGHYSVVQTLVENKANVKTNDILEFTSVFSGLHNLHQRSFFLNNGTREIELWTAFLNELYLQSALATNRGENPTCHDYTETITYYMST